MNPVDLPKTTVGSVVSAPAIVRRIFFGIAAVAAMVLLGWTLDIRLLRSPIPGSIVMNPMTAVCFFLSALALYLCRREDVPPAHRRAAFASSLIVLVVGVGRLVACFSSLDLHLDQLLFAARMATEIPPNRMAPNTALGFVLTAIVLLTLDRQSRRGFQPSQALSLITLLLAALVLMGYAYSINSLQRVAQQHPMALHTALCFAVLAYGALIARPNLGMMEPILTVRPSGATTRRLLLAVLVVPGVIGWFRLEGERFGFYGTETGVALVACCHIAIFGTVILWNARLLDRVDRARQQVEVEIVKAKEEAECANQAKSDFLSRMSHELRTPLNAILGFGQLLEMEELEEHNRESVQQVLKGGRHLLSLINEVLDIARIESGRLAMSKEPVMVKEAIEEALALVRSLTEAAEIKVTVDGALPDSYVMADRQRLKQVLLNLLSNAVKYNRKGGSVTLRCLVQDDGKLTISITDTGNGIAPEMVHRLFQPFDRLNAEQTEIEGTGLGLALSRALMQAMGGDIAVESKIGAGSTFSIDLATAADPATRVEEEMDQPVASSAEFDNARTVLYIEDNLANTQLVETILKRRSAVRLVTAQKGPEGIDLARMVRPHLVLLDLNLPEMHGSTILAEMKADPTIQDIPVVIVSADATPKQTERLIAAGAVTYLTKPFDVQEFLSVLDDLLYAA